MHSPSWSQPAETSSVLRLTPSERWIELAWHVGVCQSSRSGLSGTLSELAHAGLCRRKRRKPFDVNPALTDCENRPTCSYDIIDSFCERIQHIPALCKNPGPHHPWIPATCRSSGGTTTCVPADLRGTTESPAYAVCTGMTLWASGCACRCSRCLKVALFAQAVLWSFGSFGRVSQVNVQENGREASPWSHTC